MLGTIFAVGCARTVTSIVESGSQLVVDVRFRSDLNYTTNTYFMVIGTAESYRLPYYPDQFLEPRVPPLDPTYNPYQYYQTWQAYIVLDSSGNYFLVDGPFNNSSEAYSRINIGSIGGTDTTHLQFSFQLNKIYGTGEVFPNYIYFDVAAVDSTGFMRDNLEDYITLPPNKYISSYKGSVMTGTDDYSGSINGSLDILDWSVSIQ